MKRKTFPLLIVLLTIIVLLPLSTQATDIKLWLDGELREDAQIIIENDRTLVPIGFISRELGLATTWDQGTKTATIVSGNGQSQKVLQITIGHPVVQFDNEYITLDVTPKIVHDRTYVPLAFTGNALGTPVEWDGENRRVLVGEKPSDASLFTGYRLEPSITYHQGDLHFQGTEMDLFYGVDLKPFVMFEDLGYFEIYPCINWYSMEIYLQDEFTTSYDYQKVKDISGSRVEITAVDMDNDGNKELLVAVHTPNEPGKVAIYSLTNKFYHDDGTYVDTLSANLIGTVPFQREVYIFDDGSLQMSSPSGDVFIYSLVDGKLVIKPLN